jgi:hypothetical protein
MADGIGNGGDCCYESGVLDRLATITKNERAYERNFPIRCMSRMCGRHDRIQTILEWKSLETASLQPPFDVQEPKVRVKKKGKSTNEWIRIREVSSKVQNQAPTVNPEGEGITDVENEAWDG